MTLQRRKKKKMVKTALGDALRKPTRAAGKNGSGFRNNFVNGRVDLVSHLVLSVSLGLVLEGGGRGVLLAATRRDMHSMAYPIVFK